MNDGLVDIPIIIKDKRNSVTKPERRRTPQNAGSTDNTAMWRLDYNERKNLRIAIENYYTHALQTQKYTSILK